MLQTISTTKNMMASRTFWPTRNDNCACTLRMQRTILEAAHLMQERVHNLLFVIAYLTTFVLPTLSYETFKGKRHGVSNGGSKILFYKGVVSILRLCRGIFRKYRGNKKDKLPRKPV